MKFSSHCATPVISKECFAAYTVTIGNLAELKVLIKSVMHIAWLVMPLLGKDEGEGLPNTLQLEVLN